MRATFLASQACVPFLRQAANPHVLTLSPPLNLDPKWFAPHVAYTLSKYGMSMCMLGMAQEFAAEGIAFNCLWPRTNHRHRRHRIQFPRSHPARIAQACIVADAAHAILLRGTAKHAAATFLSTKRCCTRQA